MNLTTEEAPGDLVSDTDSDQVGLKWCLRCCIPNKLEQMLLLLLLTWRAHSEQQKLDLTLDRHRARIKTWDRELLRHKSPRAA